MASTDLAPRWAMTGALSAVQVQRRVVHLLALSGLSVTVRHASPAIFSIAAQSAREALERRDRGLRGLRVRGEESVREA